MTAAEVIAALRKVRHYECEDCWYSCPESEDGCCDDRQEGCTCSAPLMHDAADLIEAMADELEGAHHDLEVLRHELAQR
jgi:hypothetical protein